MGTGGSRLGGSPRPPSRSHHYHHQQQDRRRRRRPRFKHVVSSLLICGASPPSNPHHEMDDDPTEKLVNSSEHDTAKSQFPTKRSMLSNGSASESINYTIETRSGTERSTMAEENFYGEDVPRTVEVTDKGKSLSKNKELVLDPESIARGRVNEASTSYEEQHFPQSESVNGRTNADVVDKGTTVHQNYACFLQSSFPSNKEQVESFSDGVSVENSMGEMTIFHDCETSSPSASSPSPVHDTFQQATSPGVSFLMAERDQAHRDGNVLQVDVVSVSSNIPSTSAAELSYHDSRRNSRRLFRDAFSRRGSGRNSDASSFAFSSDDSDGFDSNDRWLLDFNTDFFANGAEGGSRVYGNTSQHPNEHRWHSSSEIWERFRESGRSDIDRQSAATCPSGVHPDGACSCGSMIRAEETGARASISRIVMLAEALFEVLDEIHRQPMSLPLSVVSLPAPELVVDSLPTKVHRKLESLEDGDDVAQCYICLAEYEEGDEIRILPCHHEYHVSCVDKWLKEVHGVCPLCRGDVREG